jgi:hypothetical protein
LDVYIFGSFGDNASESVKGFHLNAAKDYNQTTGKWRITPDWRDEGLVPGRNYTLYVAANSSKVKTSDDSATTNATQTLAAMNITSLTALGNAIEFDYNPHECNYKEDGTTPDTGTKPFWGSHNDDGVNPAWLDVHKKYTSTENITTVNAKADRYFSHDKTFLMNGTSASFSLPESSSTALPVPEVILTRAAAKIQLNVTFDTDFLARLADEKDLKLYGAPQWRFFNFAFNTPIFDNLTQTESYDPTVSRFTSSANMIGYDGIAGNDLNYGDDAGSSFSFSTYSYPLSWTAETAGEEAPAIIVSVAFLDTTLDDSLPVEDRLEYHAYKIPVVDPDNTLYSLERNNLYIINATISSEGSTLVTDAYEIKAAYEIKDWGDDSSAFDISDRDNSYIDVIPDAIPETIDATDVILRGNGTQTVRLQVLKPGTKGYGIQYYTTTGASLTKPFGQDATALNATDYTSSSPAAYYFNYEGKARTTIAVNGGSENNVQFSLTMDGEYLVITSESLANKAIKYAKIRVYLEGHKSEKYMDVNIRHIPTDAITALEGEWASRQSALYRLDTSDDNHIAEDKRIPGPEDYTYTTSSTFDRAVYDQLTCYKWTTWVACTEGEYESTPAADRRIATVPITKEEYLAHSTEEGYYETAPEEYLPTFLYYNGSTNVTNNQTAAQDWTESNPGHSGDYYYWGTNPSSSSQTLTEKQDCDWYTYTTSWGGYKYYTYYKYEHRYRKQYKGPQFQRLKFYYTTLTTPSSFPTWINWEVDSGKTYNVSTMRGARYHNKVSQNYYSRVYDHAENKMYAYNYYTSGTGSSDTINTTISKDSELSSTLNRRIYVIQFSESNSNYVIGRPIINEDTKLSDDHVVSPAFMIASQLGGTNTLPSSNTVSWAALHCASYMEVVHDEKDKPVYYSNWRLPTREEIDIIIRYQDKYAPGASTSWASIEGNTITGESLALKAVLYAKQYIALDGSYIDSNYGGGSTLATVRCVRDLTPEEIEKLNN